VCQIVLDEKFVRDEVRLPSRDLNTANTYGSLSWPKSTDEYQFRSTCLVVAIP
jgi:hypothetical protein